MIISKILLLTAFYLFSLSSVFGQDKVSSKKLDAMIQQGMKDWQVPGLAAIVVKDGEVVFKKTYGLRNVEAKQKVDDNTLFNMASTTKAIIAISIGMLVDEGKLDWNDKVRQHLPEFQLSDAYITEDARVVDLLTHNLGIGNADLLWIIDSVSSKETIQRFSQAETAYPLRGGFQYQNLMYVIAGQLIEAVSGKHWTKFVAERVFKPLEMSRSVAKSADILKAGNYAVPYFNTLDEGVIKIDHTFSDQIGAAGMIWSTTNDINNYLTFLINDGVYKGDTLLKPSTFNYLFKPHALISGVVYPTQTLVNPHWMSYGLGWFQQDYRGEKLDFHTGSIAGLVAIAGIVHDKNLGIYVFANLDHAELRHAIMYKAIDLYAFNDDSRDWNKEVFDLYSGFRSQAIESQKEQDESRVRNTKPSLALTEYVGDYKHPMYGSLKVTLEDGALALNFNDYLVFTASHWHYDVFKSRKDPRLQFDFLANFKLDETGKAAMLECFGEVFKKIE